MFRRIITLLSVTLFFASSTLFAQKVVSVNDSVNSKMFHHAEIYYLEDTTNQLSFQDVTGDRISQQFKPSEVSTPQSHNSNSTYWYRVRINYPATVRKKYILEFFDQTIDKITAYIPQEGQMYQVKHYGDNVPFNQRTFKHKNFEVEISPVDKRVTTYYFKIKSIQRADIIIVLRSINWFVYYALNEYFYFGIFYGMILVFSFYNLLIFFAVRQRQYLDFVIYMIAVGFYQMSIDGIGFQYLWPDYPGFNNYSSGISLYLLSAFSLLFTRDLLHLKRESFLLYKVINTAIIVRSAWFILCFFYPKLFSYRFIELISLSLSFFSGIYIYRKGFSPARFFVLGYTSLFIGFLVKLIIEISDGRFNISVVSYYSLSICFIVEMILLSFAITERVRMLQMEKVSYQHQLELDKSEKEIVRLKNEKLIADVSFKDKELSIMTMHLVQRGNVLAKIKEDIASIIKKHDIKESSPTFKHLIKLIKEVESGDEDWNQFTMHFNQMNSGLFELLKEKYPDLTPNELKLCAYIRQNLSTKEMAQLMNITIKAVEIGRYRLRKKLQLNSDVNLYDFLMNISRKAVI